MSRASKILEVAASRWKQPVKAPDIDPQVLRAKIETAKSEGPIWKYYSPNELRITTEFFGTLPKIRYYLEYGKDEKLIADIKTFPIAKKLSISAWDETSYKVGNCIITLEEPARVDANHLWVFIT